MKNFYHFLERLSIGKLHMLFLFFSFFISNAQVTTNSGSGLAATYPNLASAITALNGATITSPVVITLTGNETAPAGGYSITAQGNATNTITIEGVTSTITANAALTAGALNDAVFKLVGADYVTIRSFTMLENTGNTITAAATNTMTEWGIALLYATTTNGAQNNTLQGNTIDLNRTYQNTFGIYSNSTHSSTAPTTSATATTTAGANSGLKVYGNTITDVNIGIVVIGPTAAADNNDGIDIGGNSGVTGNAITNYGTTGTFSAYANLSGTVNGILVRNSKNFNISYNTITSSNGGVTAGTLRGVFIPAFSNAPTGTIVNTISYNTVSVRSAVAGGALLGIHHDATTANITTTVNINNNDFNTSGHTLAATAAVTFIQNVSIAGLVNINNNTFSNLSVNTTGNVFLINNNCSTNTFTISNNSVVGTFAKTGAGGILYGYYNFGSPTGGTATISNNNFSNLSLTGATTFYGIRQYTSTTQVENITNNTISNITGGSNTMYGVSHGYGAAGSIVNGNVINSFTGSGGIIGVNLGDGTAGTVNCFGNIVNGLTSTGAAASVVGISNTLGVLNNVYNNKIYNLEATNATGTVNGILVASGTTVSLYNNIVGDLRTPQANAANPLIGINITGGTTVNAYYNTVMLNGVSAGALFGSSAISVSTTPTVTLRNNIFVNNSSVTGIGLAASYRRSSTTLTSYAAASNTNLFYGSTIFTDGTNTDATLAAFKIRVSTRDTASITENPTFVSTTGSNVNFLHIDTTIATQIESGGSSISGITTDFDGDTRNVSTPDIGADEFAGVLADFTPPTISHTVSTASCLQGSRTISATITDASGVASGIGLPVVYWKINAGAYTATTAVDMGSGVYDFTIGSGAVYGDVIAYYFVAQDNAGSSNVTASPLAGAAGFSTNPPAVSTTPTSPFTTSVLSPLNGVYTVGTSGNYTTLTAAVNDFNIRCLSGPVVFTLLDATYPSETYPITIQQNADSNATNTLTIKPNTGVTTSISGSNANAIIKLNGADYVTIDGSNNGSTSKDLTFENTNATGTIAWIASASASNGSLNNVIKNNNFIGGSSTTTVGGVLLSGTVLAAAAESPNNNITIDNNVFTKMKDAIFAIGNATTPDSGWNITNNTIGSIVAISKLSFRGVAVQNAQSFVISGNQISGITTTSTSTTSGILVGANAFNGSVFNNTISDIKNTNIGGYGANGIQLNSSSTSANMVIYNNFIYNIAGYGYASGTAVSDNGYGVICTSGAGYSIYNNTIVLNSNQTVTGLPAAFNVTTGVTLAGAINLRNNIFVNTQTQAGERYAIYSGSANTIFSAIDYNDFYTTGTNLGFIGSARTNLAAIQAGFGQNTASLSLLPVFVSATNLHLLTTTNTAIDNKGTTIPGVTLDIDGDVRNITTPDMGADEFTSTACTLANGGTISALVTTFCDSGSTTISSAGYSTGFSTTYQWQSSVDLAFTTPINEGAALTAYADLVTPTITSTTYYRLAVTCVENGQANFSNVVTITITTSPNADAPANVTACDSYVLPALTVGNYYTGSGGTGTALSAGNTITSSQTIYVYAQTGTTPNCTDENSFTVTITTATISGATTQVINGGVAADATIEDIVVTSNGTVTWFASSTDATANTNPLPAGTVLVNGNIYYGVTNIGICRSTTLAVTVTVVLGSASFDLSQLNYYPNPVKDIFNVKYNKEIISVDVYDLTGRKVMDMKPNTLEVQLNMTNLSSAMYIVRLQSVDGITELKVYKN